MTGQNALNPSSKGFDMRFKTEKLNWSEWSGLIRRVLMAVSASYQARTTLYARTGAEVAREARSPAEMT